MVLPIDALTKIRNCLCSLSYYGLLSSYMIFINEIHFIYFQSFQYPIIYCSFCFQFAFLVFNSLVHFFISLQSFYKFRICPYGLNKAIAFTALHSCLLPSLFFSPSFKIIIIMKRFPQQHFYSFLFNETMKLSEN